MSINFEKRRKNCEKTKNYICGNKSEIIKIKWWQTKKNVVRTENDKIWWKNLKSMKIGKKKEKIKKINILKTVKNVERVNVVWKMVCVNSGKCWKSQRGAKLKTSQLGCSHITKRVRNFIFCTTLTKCYPLNVKSNRQSDAEKKFCYTAALSLFMRLHVCLIIRRRKK